MAAPSWNWWEDAFISCPLEDRALTTSNKTFHNSHETENVTKAVDHKPTDSKTCTEFWDNHYLTIDDILQIPLYRCMGRPIKSYILYMKKFWPSKFANDPQIFKQGVINDPQNFWSCRNTEPNLCLCMLSLEMIDGSMWHNKEQ